MGLPLSLHFLFISSFSLHFLAARLQGSSGLRNPEAAYIFSWTYQWYLAGVEVRIEQEGVDEDFLEKKSFLDCRSHLSLWRWV